MHSAAAVLADLAIADPGSTLRVTHQRATATAIATLGGTVVA